MKISNPHGYKIRSWVGQKESRRRAIKAFGESLYFPSDGLKTLSRAGVTFSLPQKFIVFVLYRIKLVWVQRFILWLLSREKND